MRNTKLRILTEGAIMVALAAVLSFIKIFQLPWGGSITLLSMLPVIVFSIKRGIKPGFAAAFVYSLIQLGQGIAIDGLLGWGLTPFLLICCILLDYIIPFTLLGTAGLFRKKGFWGWIAGTVLVILIRFTSHFISGISIWQTIGKLWDGFSTENIYLYSAAYNGSFMLPELVFTTIGAAVLFGVPVFKRLLMNNENDF